MWWRRGDDVGEFGGNWEATYELPKEPINEKNSLDREDDDYDPNNSSRYNDEERLERVNLIQFMIYNGIYIYIYIYIHRH